MAKRILILLLFCFIVHAARAQLTPVDSLNLEISNTKNDTLRLVLLSKLTGHFFESDFKQSSVYARQMLPLAKKMGYKIEEAYAMDVIGITMSRNSQPEGLEMLLNAAVIAADKHSETNILPKKYLDEMIYWGGTSISKERYTAELLRLDVLASIYFDLGHFYGFSLGNTKKQLAYYQQAKDILVSIKDTASLAAFFTFLGDSYGMINQLDSGLYYAKMGKRLYTETGRINYSPQVQAVIGMLYYKKGDEDSTLKYLHQAIHTSNRYGKTMDISRALLTLSDYYDKKGQIDSSLWYAKRAFDLAEQTNDFFAGTLPNASSALARLYKAQKNADSALKYYALTVSLLNTMHNDANSRLIQSHVYEENEQQQEMAAAKIKYKNRLRLYALLAGIGVLLIIGIILLRNNRIRKKANTLLKQQKDEIENTLTKLKATQSQLIQSEKMASLGELTAGIAHEIQNPLNFVNNFSEVNKELIVEMKGEIQKGNIEEIKSIAEDIEANEEKINHHGKRADAIVKGMLQHSRATTGQKEPTDINALADEYLRLSYQGLRAKDKAFNATLKTDFDESIEKINIIPQDIGRVLLNLYNNAFYAVTEKKKQQVEGYEPLVTVGTKRIGDKVEIKVADNGDGIPQKVVDKIFQPFFTTKPTGQGTGLGLSLSYDIIRAHGGEIKVETKEGERTEFIIKLPIMPI